MCSNKNIYSIRINNSLSCVCVLSPSRTVSTSREINDKFVIQGTTKFIPKQDSVSPSFLRLCLYEHASIEKYRWPKQFRGVILRRECIILSSRSIVTMILVLHLLISCYFFNTCFYVAGKHLDIKVPHCSVNKKDTLTMSFSFAELTGYMQPTF